MVSKKKTKKCLMIHAIKRFKERYNKDFTLQDINNINSIIRSNKFEDTEVVNRQSNIRVLFLVKYKDNIYPCPYNSKLHSISTVLPSDKFLLNKLDFLERRHK